jgi:hypothetical protein
MGFDMVILTPYKVNGSFLPNDRLHKNSYTLFLNEVDYKPLVIGAYIFTCPL